MRTKIWLNAPSCLGWDKILTRLFLASLMKLLGIFFSTRPQTLASVSVFLFPVLARILSFYPDSKPLISDHPQHLSKFLMPTISQVISNHPGLPSERVLLDLFNHSPPPSSLMFPFSSSSPTDLLPTIQLFPWLQTPPLVLALQPVLLWGIFSPTARVPQ